MVNIILRTKQLRAVDQRTRRTMKGARRFLVRLSLSFLVVGVLALTSVVGSFLNRGVGGFIYFGGPRNESDPHYVDWYWSRQVLSKAYFALPTGLLVLVVGLHWKAAFVVALMTLFSLSVKWDSYVNIGTVDNLYSRSGYLDWLVGRQGVKWSINQRFIREYAGLSLQGLIWTAPQGYLLEYLGFGWEYCLSGSLMGIVYYVGSQANMTSLKSTFLNSNIALSECLWGWFIWFVLSIMSVSQLVKRARIKIYRRNPYLGYKPFSHWEVLKYESLNRLPFRIAFEVFILVLNLVFCCSVVYYELVEQRDLQNKGQIFFGLFTAVLCLTFTQAWSWSIRYLRYQQRKVSKATSSKETPQRAHSMRSQPSQHTTPNRPGSTTPRTNQREGQLTRARHKREPIQKAVERVKEEFDGEMNENEPLLTWPYSHPDRLSPIREGESKTEGGGSGGGGGGGNRLQLPEGETEYGMTYKVQPATTSTALLILWENIEKWVWMDMFVWIRRLFGIITCLNILVLLVVVAAATVQGWGNPRFMQMCSNYHNY